MSKKSLFLISLFTALCLNIPFQNLKCEIILPEIIQPLIMNQEGMHKSNSTFENFSVYLQSGYMTGQGNEYVLIGDYKLSHLIWDIDSLYLAGGGIEWNINKTFTLNADLWFKADDGKAMMEDYDWKDEEIDDWTHWSHHDNTTVTKANIIDIYTTYTPHEFRNRALKFYTILGYKRTNFEWEARGGSYIYSKDSFRDIEGTFPDNELGITYEQILNTPYVGLGWEIPIGIFFINTKLCSSYAVFGKAIDHHHLRDLTTTAYFFWGQMASLEASSGFRFNRGFTLKGDFSYNWYGSLRGNSEYNQSGVITVYEDLEGADFESIMFSISLNHSF